VELAACGLPRAEIPDRTNNMQSAIIHVLSLVCSLLIISSLVRLISPGLPITTAEVNPQGVQGASRHASGGNIMTLQPIRVNSGKRNSEGLESGLFGVTPGWSASVQSMADS
jgi:hypothetical protein